MPQDNSTSVGSSSRGSKKVIGFNLGSIEVHLDLILGGLGTAHDTFPKAGKKVARIRLPLHSLQLDTNPFSTPNAQHRANIFFL